jgi:hypothetical protein
MTVEAHRHEHRFAENQSALVAIVVNYSKVGKNGGQVGDPVVPVGGPHSQMGFSYYRMSRNFCLTFQAS